MGSLKVKLKYSMSKGQNTYGYHKYRVYTYDNDNNKWTRTKYHNCYYGSNCAFSPLYYFLVDHFSIEAIHDDIYCYCTKSHVQWLLNNYDINITEYNEDHKNDYYFEISK